MFTASAPVFITLPEASGPICCRALFGLTDIGGNR